MSKDNKDFLTRFYHRYLFSYFKAFNPVYIPPTQNYVPPQKIVWKRVESLSVYNKAKPYYFIKLDKFSKRKWTVTFDVFSEKWVLNNCNSRSMAYFASPVGCMRLANEIDEEENKKKPLQRIVLPIHLK